MADTKQATPELEVIVEEIWRHYNRGDTTDAVLTLKAALDSRSGPDRTTQEREETCMHGTPISVNCGNCEAGDTWPIPEAGPDRGQQDAPLDGKLHGAQPISEDWEQVWDLLDRWKQVWHGDRGKYISEYPAWIVSASEELFAHDMCDAWNWNDYVKAAAVIIQRHFAAKAAREGQESRGDRIKVEREPGCKCEYAIWTNAKGCPLHDVSDPVQAVRVGQAPTGDGK